MTPITTELQFGVQHPLQILVIEPLFEEANRCRRLIAQFMRALDTQGVGSAIATLPGCGESVTLIEGVAFADWTKAVADTVNFGGFQAIASFRGGALLESGASIPVWRFAPETGARMARDLERTRLAGTSNLYAGHRLSDTFLADLRAANPPPQSRLRTVRLDSDAAEADAKIVGTPLWRRAEPDENPAMSHALAEDIANWLTSCAKP